MQAAERGFRRLDTALDSVGPEALTQILRSLKVSEEEPQRTFRIERQIPWKTNHQMLSKRFQLSKPQPRKLFSPNASD
jgi:hypothetical protein